MAGRSAALCFYLVLFVDQFVFIGPCGIAIMVRITNVWKRAHEHDGGKVPGRGDLAGPSRAQPLTIPLELSEVMESMDWKMGEHYCFHKGISQKRVRDIYTSGMLRYDEPSLTDRHHCHLPSRRCCFGGAACFPALETTTLLAQYCIAYYGMFGRTVGSTRK